MRLDLHHFHHPDESTAEHFRKVERMLGIIIDNQERLMIDATKILAAVAAEKTESASLRALAAAQSQAMKDLSGQLQAAIGANDPAAMAKVQADLDQAATDLSADNDATAAAITANTAPAAS